MPRMSRRTMVSVPIPPETYNPYPDPDPEPPAAPPIIILASARSGLTPEHHACRPHDQEQIMDPGAPNDNGSCQPHSTTSSPAQDISSVPRYNLRKTTIATAKPPKEPTPDPFPCAPPVIILSTKRPASSSPPRSPSSITTSPTTTHPPSSDPPSATSITSTTIPTTAQLSIAPTPATANPHSQSTSYFPDQPLPAVEKAATAAYHSVLTPSNPPYTKHKMGSKASKIAPTHGKLQSSQEKQDKAEMKEPSNYYTHRSKSMRRKAGKTGATSGVGGAGGAAVGGAGGAV